MMYRLAYRNRGGVDSLIVTQAVDPDGAGPRSSAVRWYEIRNPLSNPNDADLTKRPYIYQSGIYDPGAAGDRWLSSAAMDKHGNILVGYSMVDSAAGIKPSIAIAGRTQSETPGTFEAEQIAYTGTGSQTGTLSRWGDYSTMQVDPSDDETFWYIGEYLNEDGSFNWRTRLVSFRFQSTMATTSGDFNAASNWTNGVPTSTVTAVVPAGKTMSINTPTTIANLEVQSGGSLLMYSNLDVTGSLTLNEKIDTGSNTLGLGCQATVALTAPTAYVVGNVRKDFCSIGSFTYPSGTANGYSPVTASVTTLTTNPSSLTIKAVQSTRNGMDTTNSLRRYWSLSLAGSLTTDLVFKYNDSDVAGSESYYKLYRWNGSNSTEVMPIVKDMAANTISISGISAFSDWAIGSLAPTASNASIAGRVISPTGAGVPNTTVILSDRFGNSRAILTSPFGYYRFDNVPAGQAMTLTVRSKRYQFDPRMVALFDDLVDCNLTGR
jgi:hypothetical protein